MTTMIKPIAARVIEPRRALHQDNAPLAMVWLTCRRDMDALKVSMESAVDVVPPGTTFHAVFDQAEYPTREYQDELRAIWPDIHFAASTAPRNGNLNGIQWVAEQFTQFYNAPQINPKARYVAKIDSDMVLYHNAFLRALRPERWMLHGMASRFRGYTSCWGALYFAHRDYVEYVATRPDVMGLLHELNAARQNKFGDFPEDQVTAQLAVHLWGEKNVWFHPTADWMSVLLGRWHYAYPDDHDRNHYWLYDALEFGLIGQIVARYKCAVPEAYTIRDRTMRRHLDASRHPRKYSPAERGVKR